MLASLVLLLCPLQAQPVIELPKGEPIVFDGKVGAAEWDNSFSVSRPMGEKHKGRLSMRRVGPWLAIGLSADRPYQGEILRIVVANDVGSWICTLFCPVGQPHMPPGLWRRGAPQVMARVDGRPESPRAVRARVHVAARWRAGRPSTSCASRRSASGRATRARSGPTSRWSASRPRRVSTSRSPRA